MHSQKSETAKAGTLAVLEKEKIESLSTTDTRAGVDSQGPAPGVLSWLDRHAAHLLPGHGGFAWNAEPLTAWRWPTGKPFLLSEVAALGAMFTTSCRYDKKPLPAPDESRDTLNLAPLRTGHLCMDFDSKEARALALADVRRLVFEVLPPLGIAPEQVSVFLSGGKGFHCIVYADALGLEGGNRLLPRIYKGLVKEIGAVLPTLDLSIYNMGMGRQFRLPQIRRGNGLHKIPLTTDEVRDGGLTIEEMMELARKPRLDVDMPPIVPSAPDAPIRAMVERIRQGVWSRETSRPARQEFDSEDLEALAAELPPCMVKLMETEDYSEIGPNFDTIISEVVVPHCAEARIAPDDAEELYGDWAAGFVGSGTYYTADMRLAQLRQKLNRPARRFDCSIVRARVKGFSCNGCAVHAREAVKAFQDAPVPDLPPNAPKRDNGAVVERLNQNHAHVIIGSKTYVLRENADDEESITFMSSAAFREWYAHTLVPVGENKAEPLGSYWLAHPKHRQAQGFGFWPHPRTPKPGHVNMYRGFAIKQAHEPRPQDCALFVAHIRRIICNSNPVLFEYVMAWLADLFQNPGGGKPGVALVLRGGRGTGKGTFTGPLLSMIGKMHAMQINNQNRLTGRFNGHLADKLLLVCDEAFWSGDKRQVGVIKGLITEATLDVERKGVDSVTVDSYLRIVLSSNERWVVPAGEDERRFCCLDVSDEKAQDHAYFAPIHREMDAKGQAAFMQVLMAWDTSGVNLRQAPSTAALVDQKLAGLDAVGRWWHGVLLAGGYTTPGGVWTAWPDTATTEDLHRDYRASLAGSGERACAKADFAIHLRRFCPGARRGRLTTSGGRAWGYKLPALRTAREEFERVLNCPQGGLDWQETELNPDASPENF